MSWYDDHAENVRYDAWATCGRARRWPDLRVVAPRAYTIMSGMHRTIAAGLQRDRGLVFLAASAARMSTT
ncbi:MAG: hypothetical protein KF779_01110 [Hyphomonadaceae bacterium]|nr:hypothetical protein [Hyphomonadaceae bacterium]